jgi:hypothetical protein
VESDVNTTLSELERKLKELERELESVGRGGELDSEPAQAGWNGAPEPVEAPPLRGPAPPPFAPAPPVAPPPPGATPLTAVWHGGATPPGPPPEPPPGTGEPVRVAPPPAPHAFVQHAAPPPVAPPPPAPPGLHEQLDELIAFRDRLVRSTDDLVAELSRVLTELGVAAPAPPPPPDPANTPLAGDVTLHAATFADLATLAGLEQALRATPGVADVYVRALDQGHATLDVRLATPTALGAALRATWPIPFQVTAAGDGHLAITLA